MFAFTKHNISVPSTEIGDSRIGHLLADESSLAVAPRVVIIGFPCDEGVAINGGRPGACFAPENIRKYLYRLTPDPRDYARFSELLSKTVDLGDLQLQNNLSADHETLSQVVSYYLGLGAIPIILGGGHETSYGHFCGYVQQQRSVRIVNWDAHLDVRPLKQGKAHSGSPFRQALEHPSGLCAGYKVIGLQPSAVGQRDFEYARSKNVSLTWIEQVNEDLIVSSYEEPSVNSDSSTTAVMATFDVDAVASSYAPGVSAPCVNGFTTSTWYKAAYYAGRSANVSSIDIVETNPKFDDSNHLTARLVATTIWYILNGLSQRDT